MKMASSSMMLSGMMIAARQPRYLSEVSWHFPSSENSQGAQTPIAGLVIARPCQLFGSMPGEAFGTLLERSVYKTLVDIVKEAVGERYTPPKTPSGWSAFSSGIFDWPVTTALPSM